MSRKNNIKNGVDYQKYPANMNKSSLNTQSILGECNSHNKFFMFKYRETFENFNQTYSTTSKVGKFVICFFIN